MQGMSKTRLTVVTAILIAVISLLLLGLRGYALGDDLRGPRGASSWKITIVASGSLRTEEGTVALSLPPDFRHQHITDEASQSKELSPARGKMQRREMIWRSARVDKGTQPFLLTYSFRCRVGMRQPTEAMKMTGRELDAAPKEGQWLRATSDIESDHKEISAQARELLGMGPHLPVDQVQALYDYVAGLMNEPTLNSRTALECLHGGGGDTRDKSRLLVALCRNRGISARLVGGLILAEGKETSPHWWAEAWINNHWWPMCPTHRHFGSRHLPNKYLVLQVADSDIFRVRNGQLRYEFTIQDLHAPFAAGDENPATGWRGFWHKWSLYNLQSDDQFLIKFLLLLPLAALVVSICRTALGVPTFGTFTPALLGLMFMNVPLLGLPWVIGIFLVIILIGWGLRHLLDRCHLLQVPRVSAMLTLIVVFLVAAIVVASQYGVLVAKYITLFPLVILTHLIERFWMLETEDGTTSSLRSLLGTLGVAAAVSLVALPPPVIDFLFTYPEALGVIFALQLLLGRYTGYRLAEIFRFRDLLQEARTPAQVS
jgi:transglutaminase-like putative cysteine protease